MSNFFRLGPRNSLSWSMGPLGNLGRRVVNWRCRSCPVLARHVMKKLLGAVVLLVLVVTSVWSQPALRIMTRPKAPSRDVLERLNLSLAWQTRLATGGQRDGLFTLQLIPARKRMQLVVQTISGTVYMLDAETGDPLWHTSAGIPGWSGQPEIG